MRENVQLRLWFIIYYLSGISIPFMILFGLIFNRFNVVRALLNILACLFQMTMFLGLKLRNHQALFMYSTTLLTLVHIGMFVSYFYMTYTLTGQVRSQLESSILGNRTEFQLSIQIKLCKRPDRSRASSTIPSQIGAVDWTELRTISRAPCTFKRIIRLSAWQAIHRVSEPVGHGLLGWY